MPPFRPSLTRLARSAASTSRTAAREALAQRQPPAPFPVISTCPPSTCNCAETPPGLDIDRTANLNGTMVGYHSHILVPTGQTDWLSKIEDEQATSRWGKYTAELKGKFGRGGEYHDDSRSVLINTSAFTPQHPATKPDTPLEAILFPSFHHVVASSSVQQTVEILASDSTIDGPHVQTRTIKYPMILICTHGGRDKRCGTLGPLLQAEFERQIEWSYSHELPLSQRDDPSEFDTDAVNIGGISHIGGHKWAGNVIIYIPPKWNIFDEGVKTGLSPLAGHGIWYGRVEPKHVDGIIQETLLQGRVIQELFRGGIDEQSTPIRL